MKEASKQDMGALIHGESPRCVTIRKDFPK